MNNSSQDDESERAYESSDAAEMDEEPFESSFSGAEEGHCVK